MTKAKDVKEKWFKTPEEAREYKSKCDNPDVIVEYNAETEEYGVVIPKFNYKEMSDEEMIYRLKDHGYEMATDEEVNQMNEEVIRRLIAEETNKKQKDEYMRHRDTTIDIDNGELMECYNKINNGPKVQIPLTIRRNSDGKCAEDTRIMTRNGMKVVNQRTGEPIMEMYIKGSINIFGFEVPLGPDLGPNYNSAVTVMVTEVVAMSIADSRGITFFLPRTKNWYVPPSVREKQKSLNDVVHGGQQMQGLGFNTGSLNGVAQQLNSCAGYQKFGIA